MFFHLRWSVKSRPKRYISCAYCGQENPKKLDHIPPKSLFPKGSPHLITVPCCGMCEKDWSHDDEHFRNLVSSVTNRHDGGAAHQANKKFLASLKNPKKAAYAKMIRESVMYLKIQLPNGFPVYIPVLREKDPQRILDVVRRIIRGFSYFEFGYCVPEDYVVLVPNNMKQLRGLLGCFGHGFFSSWNHRNKEVFSYSFRSLPGDRCSAAWALCFYESLVFVGVVLNQDFGRFLLAYADPGS